MHLTLGLHRALQRHPDAVMTICGDRTRTFREVANRVARLAGVLQERGIGASDRVALLALNSDRYSECLLAVPWADAVVVPLNTRWSPSEIDYVLEDSGATAVVIDDAFVNLLPVIRAADRELLVLFAGEGPVPEGSVNLETLIASSSPIPDARRGGDELAGLFYTGGTTGFPKGVMLTHDNLGVSALGGITTEPSFGRLGTCLHAAPMFHLADLFSWNIGVVTGGRHVMIPAFRPDAVLSAIATHRVTSAVFVPTMIRALLDYPGLGEHDTTSMRHVLYGGAPMPRSLLERAMAAFPNAEFVQAYGMTETAGLITMLAAEDHRQGVNLGAAGRVVAHAEACIVDAEGNELPRGETGEVVVRGDHVTPGYWNRPTETASAFCGDWLRTGDAGVMDADGYIEVVDRIKDMIVTGGENVYSAEVEAALCTHPGIAAAAVIGLPDPDWGECVHAVLVARDGISYPDPADIGGHVRSRLAGYKVPRSFEFVEALPMSAAGKVLKRELRAQAAATQSEELSTPH